MQRWLWLSLVLLACGSDGDDGLSGPVAPVAGQGGAGGATAGTGGAGAAQGGNAGQGGVAAGSTGSPAGGAGAGGTKPIAAGGAGASVGGGGLAGSPGKVTCAESEATTPECKALDACILGKCGSVAATCYAPGKPCRAYDECALACDCETGCSSGKCASFYTSECKACVTGWGTACGVGVCKQEAYECQFSLTPCAQTSPLSAPVDPSKCYPVSPGEYPQLHKICSAKCGTLPNAFVCNGDFAPAQECVTTGTVAPTVCCP